MQNRPLSIIVTEKNVQVKPVSNVPMSHYAPPKPAGVVAGGMIMNRPDQNAVVGKIYKKPYWRCQCPEPKNVGGQRSRLEWCNDCDKII